MLPGANSPYTEREHARLPERYYALHYKRMSRCGKENAKQALYKVAKYKVGIHQAIGLWTVYLDDLLPGLIPKDAVFGQLRRGLLIHQWFLHATSVERAASSRMHLRYEPQC